MLTIQPSKKLSSVKALLAEMQEIKNRVHSDGVVLIKNFNINTAEKFKSISDAYTDTLIKNNGEHINTPGIPGVFTPVDYSSKEKLLWHNENSFNQTWPLMIMFAAAEPAVTGGETPVVDSRLVLQELSKDLVSEFSQKGVLYTRSHGYDVGKSWQEIYQTDDKSSLETKLKSLDIDFQWFSDEKLITRQRRPAIVSHPLTSELSWFTQAQHWHPYCLDAKVRQSLLAMFEPEQLPRNCRFGDGSVIPDEMIQQILDAYQKLEISFKWQIGDLMILDNVLFAHARNPYHGHRKLFVSMGIPARFVGNNGDSMLVDVVN